MEGGITYKFKHTHTHIHIKCVLKLCGVWSRNLEGGRQADPLGNSRHLPLQLGQPVPMAAPGEGPVPSTLKPRSVCRA